MTSLGLMYHDIAAVFMYNRLNNPPVHTTCCAHHPPAHIPRVSAWHFSILGLVLSVELTWFVGIPDGQGTQASAAVLNHCLLNFMCCAVPLSRPGSCLHRVSAHS